MDAQIGSLEVGKTANIVLWTGSPVQMSSRVEKLIISGRIIPVERRQTRLRDRFSKAVREGPAFEKENGRGRRPLSPEP